MAKTFMKDGKWIDKPTGPSISVCKCGGKYIKTRTQQKKCLRCISDEK